MGTDSRLCRVRSGGMGLLGSYVDLVKAISRLGQGGTLSCVLLELALAHTLQRGDPSGEFRRALSHFQYQAVPKKVLAAYYVKGGIPLGKPYRGVPLPSVNPTALETALVICAVFAHTWLAKQGHDNPVSGNWLTKIDMRLLPGILGFMLAGGDVITMGAGLPMQIPLLIDDILAGRTLTYRVPVSGPMKTYTMSLNPETFLGGKLPPMQRPWFIPIVASHRLASIFRHKFREDQVNGFAVIDPISAGHTAWPAEILRDEHGQPSPVYGPADKIDYKAISALGLPWWKGGGCGLPEELELALSQGATGVQAASIYSVCEESGLNEELKQIIRQRGYEGTLVVKADMHISATGYLFKVVQLDGTVSDLEIRASRERVCNKGALLTAYETSAGTIGYRCPAMPVADYEAKGGDLKDTVDKACLCNALLALTPFGDVGEPSVFTLSPDVRFLRGVMRNAQDTFTAQQSTEFVLGKKL